MIDNHQKNIATFIHLSTFSRFFFPLGNFIGPLILWVANKEKSTFVDRHGKQAINFQISILLYAIIIGTLSIPFFIFNVLDGTSFISFNGLYDFHINVGKPSPLLYITGGLGILAFLAFLLEMVFIIKASLTAKEGEPYDYPLTIKFIK